MKFTQAELGRVFVIRLEDGEIVHETIEAFAKEKSIHMAALVVVGGVETGSRLVVGPEDGQSRPIHPMEAVLSAVHEVSGTGTLFPDEKGDPVLHMHMACGRGDHTVTGCIRSGVKVWQVMEVILFELTGGSARRVLNPILGFKLLDPEQA
jgi:predicted DNA-binding protein with PD1-like motif